MSIQDADIKRKDMGHKLQAVIVQMGWGMGMVGALLIAWSAGKDVSVAPPYLLKGVFQACPGAAILGDPGQQKAEIVTELAPVLGPYVASKRGSKYYPVGCGAAASLSPKNIISFSSVAEAQAAGYTSAANCNN